MTEQVAVNEASAPVTAPEVAATTTDTAQAAAPTPADDAAALLKLAKEVFDGPDAAIEPATDGADAVSAATDPDSVAAKPAEVKKPVDEKTAERIARAHRAEERVKKQLEASQYAKMELAREREQIQREREAIAQERAVYARLKSGDPLEILEAVGVDKLDFVKRVAQAPEVIDPVNAKIAQLEARAEQAERRRLEVEQAQANYVFEQNVGAAKQNFVHMLQTNAEKFPNVVRAFSPAEAAHRAFELTRTYNDAYRAKYGKPIDDAAVAEYLEYEAEQIAASRTWGNGAQASQIQQLPQSDRAATSDQAGVAHTLTNSGASTASVAKRERTQEEIDAECVRILAAAYGG